MAKRVMAVRFLRLIGLCILLAGLCHLVGICFLTAKGRSELLFTFILFGVVLTIGGVWLLRADLTPLFAPSSYDVTISIIALVILLYYASWIIDIGKSFWRLVLAHSPLSVAQMYPIVGIGFLLTFVLASCVCGFHVTMLLSSRLRYRFHPSLLSHLAALFLLIPSLKLSSNMAATIETFFSVPSKPSNPAMRPSAVLSL